MENKQSLKKELTLTGPWDHSMANVAEGPLVRGMSVSSCSCSFHVHGSGCLFLSQPTGASAQQCRVEVKYTAQWTEKDPIPVIFLDGGNVSLLPKKGYVGWRNLWGIRIELESQSLK